MSESSSKFLQAVKASRLLSEDQIEQAMATISAASGAPSEPLVQISDELLAEKMVQLGMLNDWQAEQLRAGRTKFNLNDYQIIDSLGQGGMGQVFKAEHSLMGRVVAIKVLPKSKSTPTAVKSFQHEIRTLAKLDDPNLVRAYDAGHDGNVYYLVTEFVPGADLRRLVRSGGPLAQRNVATIISQAAAGLQHAHEQGLIHRDVKPGNLMVTPEGKTKVLDLGLAGFLREEDENKDPRKGRIVGTADYLAPEQIMSPSKVTPASDIYSLGCTMYFAVTGEVPFPGGKMREKCYRHMHEAPLHPRRYNQELSDEFLDVLADMMEKDPQQRIGTAADVVHRLALWTDDAVTTPLPKDPLPEDKVHFARLHPSSRPSHGESVDDTRDFPELSPGELESPSQLSQGTEGVNQASQETAPSIAPPAKPPRRRKRPPAKPAPPVGQVIPPWLIVVSTITGLLAMLIALLALLSWLLS
jgi:serine/threonine protein kinase